MKQRSDKLTYSIQAEVSQEARAALLKAQGRKQDELGKRVKLVDIAAQWIEEKAKEV